MSDTIAKYSFLPWSRQGIARLLANADPLDGTLPASVSPPVRLQVNAAHDVDLTLRLFGPGDVTGLDPRQVIRTEPRDQTKDFIPNYLPAVEFARPDLPWMFTPAAKGARDRLRPWICLVVVEKQAGVSLSFGRQLVLPILEIRSPAVPAVELPPLDESWAWAHVQVAGTLGADRTLEQVMEREPHNVTSRLLCPRKLLPDSDYIACLVPAFDIGRKTGLGLPADDATLAPSWRLDAPPAAIQIPVYYHWEFSTGRAGDFEALARLLQARPVPDTVGIRPMDIGAPGFGFPELAPDAPGRILGLEGALRAPDAQRTEWPEPAQTDFQSALRNVLDAPDILAPQDEPGPLVAPPLYGRWHAGERTVPDDEPRWFRQLNLDPRERTVSGFGTMVVQDQQESLMHSAWEQVDDVLAANRLLARAQLARSVSAATLKKNLIPLAVDPLLRIARPLHSRVRMSPFTLKKLIDDSRVPSAGVDNALRRIARPRGPLARRIYGGNAPQQALVQRINAGEIAAASEQGMPDGSVTTDAPADVLWPTALPESIRSWLRFAFPVSLILSVGALLTTLLALLGGAGIIASLLAALGISFGGVTLWLRRNLGRLRAVDLLQTARFSAQEVEAAPPRPTFRLLNADEKPADAVARRGGADSAAAGLFRAAASEFQATVEQAATLARPTEKPALSLDEIRATLLVRLDPKVTVPARVRDRIDITPGLWSPPDPLEPIMAYPRFERPMYEPLRDLSPTLLLPGLEAVKPNTVTLLETNPRFIEAYMVGLNHELGRELLWREYPTDQRGSYFRQFWDVRGNVPPPRTPQERERLKDIPLIHGWAAANDLGGNMTGGSVEGRLVLLVRGELLRRFPTAVVYAAKAQFEVDGGGRPTRDRVPVNDASAEKYPLFRGTLDPDVTFVGFDLAEDEARGDPDPEQNRPGWFFVIQQQPTEPRFGLDVVDGFAATLPPLTAWNDLSWGHLAANESDFAGLSHITLASELPATSNVSQPPGVAWGENAAHQAFVTLQKPVRIAIHADDMLPASS